MPVANSSTRQPTTRRTDSRSSAASTEQPGQGSREEIFFAEIGSLAKQTEAAVAMLLLLLLFLLGVTAVHRCQARAPRRGAAFCDAGGMPFFKGAGASSGDSARLRRAPLGRTLSVGHPTSLGKQR